MSQGDLRPRSVPASAPFDPQNLKGQWNYGVAVTAILAIRKNNLMK